MSMFEYLAGYIAYLLEKVQYLESVYAQFADIERVVRCRDCAKCEEKLAFGRMPVLECSRDDHVVEPDGFCKWGERRSEP